MFGPKGPVVNEPGPLAHCTPAPAPPDSESGAEEPLSPGVKARRLSSRETISPEDSAQL